MGSASLRPQEPASLERNVGRQTSATSTWDSAASTSPKNAAEKAVHLLHRPRGLHRASCFCSEQAGDAAYCWRETDERSPRPQLSEIQEINARLRMCPGGGPADTYHNFNQP